MIIAEHKEPLPATVTDGITLFTTHVRRAAPDTLDPKLNAHSKLNDITACIQAYTAGADEALMLDPHGFVATCNSTHFFIVAGPDDAPEVLTSDGRYTPRRDHARQRARDLCRANGIPARETTFSLTDVYSAREAFVTGTFAGVVPVRSVDGRTIGDGRRGPVVERLQGAVPRARRRRRGGARRAMSDVVRVAMWSGPRNISTAMMRAFENRPDTVVVDEPLYAAYLARTGIDHPVREEVIASQPTDLATAVAGLVRAAAARPPRPLRQAHGPPRLARHGPAAGRCASATCCSSATRPRSSPRTCARGRPASPRTSGCRSRAGCSSCGTSTASRCRSSTPATSCARPRRTCAGCATGSASRSPTGCCPGRRARATPTACGRRTGTPPSGPRPASSRGARGRSTLSDHDAAVAEACRPIYDGAARPAGAVLTARATVVLCRTGMAR